SSHGFVDQRLRLCDIRSKPLGIAQVLVGDKVRIRLPDPDRGQLVVLAIEHELQLPPERRRVEQVAYAQPNPTRLIDVGRPNAATSRAEAALLSRCVLGAVKALVVRHDQVRRGAHAQPAGIDLARAKLIELGYQQARMHGDTRADNAQRPRIEDARWYE